MVSVGVPHAGLPFILTLNTHHNYLRLQLMKFSTRKAFSSHFRLARMAQKDNQTGTAQKPTPWSALQFLVATILTAFAATLFLSYWGHNAPPSTDLSMVDSTREITTFPKVKILSLDPFIAHITDFVSKSEIEHLMNLGYVS